MSWTKGDFVRKALEEIGYASYIYDLMPEQLDSVLGTLDAMMGTWDMNSIRVGWPMASTQQDADLNTVTNVDTSLNETIYTNLAVRIAGRFGKTVRDDTKAIAKSGYSALLNKISFPQSRQFPETLPLGQGNKPYRRTNRQFFPVPTDPLQADKGTTLEFD